MRGEREQGGEGERGQDQCEVHSEKMSVYCWTCRLFIVHLHLSVNTCPPPVHFDLCTSACSPATVHMSIVQLY